MAKKIIVLLALLVFLGGYFLFEGADIVTPKTENPPRTLQARDPNESIPLEEPSEPNPISDILDFNEANKFDSIEEIRFTMKVGKTYRLQKFYEYSYQGIGISSGITVGKIHIKSTSDPEFIKESNLLVQVGYSFAIGFAPPAEGRHYSVTPIEIGPTTLKLRIKTIMD